MKVRAFSLAPLSPQNAESPLPDSLEWMPGGNHTITASVDGKGKECKVKCTEADAAALDKQLQAALQLASEGKASRPYIDFDHTGGEAAAIPVKFFWQDGIRLAVEWTTAGSAALRGRTYSYFSPEFLLSEDGTIAGLPDVGPIGALVNTPAFQNIERLAASLPSGKPNKPMTELLKALVAAGISLPENATDVQAAAAFSNAWANLKTTSDTAAKNLADVSAKYADAEKEIKAAREVKANSIVAEAVRAGKIKDDAALKDRWVKALLADEAGTVSMIEAIQVAAASGHPNTNLPKSGTPGKSPAEVLAHYESLPQGKERDEFFRANTKLLLQASRAK